MTDVLDDEATFREKCETNAKWIANDITNTLAEHGIVAEVTATARGVIVVPLHTWKGHSDEYVMLAALNVARASVAYYLDLHTQGHVMRDHYWAHIIGRPSDDYSIDVEVAPIERVEPGSKCGCNY